MNEFCANNPTAAAGFMAKKFFGSEKVMSATAQLLARNKAVMKDLPVPGKVNNQPPISGYAAFVEAHADAFPDAQARQSVQSTPATQKQVSQKVVASQATVPQPAPASTRQSTAARQDVSSSKSIAQSVKDFLLPPGIPRDRGFIAGPGAWGFNKAKEAGRTFTGVDKKVRFEVSDEGTKLTLPKIMKGKTPIFKAPKNVIFKINAN